MLGWFILLIVLGILGYLFYETREMDKMSDPMTKTDTGKTASGYERNVFNKGVYNQVRKKKKNPKKRS